MTSREIWGDKRVVRGSMNQHADVAVCVKLKKEPIYEKLGMWLVWEICPNGQIYPEGRYFALAWPLVAKRVSRGVMKKRLWSKTTNFAMRSTTERWNPPIPSLPLY
jgi:hypothetical protein